MYNYSVCVVTFLLQSCSHSLIREVAVCCNVFAAMRVCVCVHKGAEMTTIDCAQQAAAGFIDALMWLRLFFGSPTFVLFSGITFTNCTGTLNKRKSC